MEKTILFLCVGNTCRSPMAEGIAKKKLNQNYKILSAGCSPGEKVSRKAVQVMNEIGIDISNHIPRAFSLDILEKSNIIISMGEGIAEACPFDLSSYNVLDWGLEDPYGKDIGFYRKIRDEINKMVYNLIEVKKSL
jgi:arsenate reductase (thioredoxin)